MNGPTDANARTQDAEHQIQGEGDYDAARRYDKAAREFAESGKVDEAAHRAQPGSPEEAEELRRAEREGRSHAKGGDSLLTHPEKTKKPGN